MWGKVIQLYIYYIYINIFFARFFSTVGYYKILSIVPWAIQEVLVVNIFFI